jgi:hypothetical protein
MWRTPEGKRVLAGAEWDLFREGLGFLWDEVEFEFDDGMEDNACVGVVAFDRLQPGQKLALLALVGEALRDPAVPPPDLTACNEAAVAAVYRHVALLVEFEIEAGRDPDEDPLVSMREMVRAAYRRHFAPYRVRVPKTSYASAGRWADLVEVMSEGLLWGTDFEDFINLLDLDPGRARRVRERFGIPDDYFTAPAPDPTDAQLEAVRSTLRRLCGRREPPAERGLVPGFQDDHHDLLVGFCTPEEVATEEAASRLVGEIGMCGDEGFDCTYAEWVRFFRDDVRRASGACPTRRRYRSNSRWRSASGRSGRAGSGRQSSSTRASGSSPGAACGSWSTGTSPTSSTSHRSPGRGLGGVRAGAVVQVAG